MSEPRTISIDILYDYPETWDVLIEDAVNGKSTVIVDSGTKVAILVPVDRLEEKGQ